MFKKLNQSISLLNLKNLTNCTFKEDIDLGRQIFGVSTLDSASEGDAVFLSNLKYIDLVNQTKASFCFVSPEFASGLSDSITPLISEDPYLAFSKLVFFFYGDTEYLSASSLAGEISDSKNSLISNAAKIDKNVKIGSNVCIDEDAEIGEGSVILSNSFIGSGVKIGKNVIIYDNVSVYHAVIGDNSIIRSGVRIGNLGFGFVPDFKKGEHFKNPHIARVLIGKNVDIGCNTTIDRGYLKDTIVGDNTKIDNLVQIAHGAKIGKSCFLAAQVGVSGSTELGDFVFCGGQVGFAGHLKIASYSRFVAQSGIAQDIYDSGKEWAGSPALLSPVWKRIHVLLKRMVNNK